MKKMIFPILILFVFLINHTAFSAEETVGRPVLKIADGEKGDVTFPHEKHQQTLKDCTLCHSLFPKKPGVVREMITDGKLKRKQVMNHCLACHKAKKKEGLKTGPTSCSKCHN
ncbi:MAG: cytochrome c family protein [Proteobacteria bacterium]|nr:cytochrome c family protein [Pseudomonadota bacterium]